MLLNPFVIKKYAALMSTGFLTVFSFFIGLRFYGFYWGILLLFVGLLVGVLLANTLLKNPFSQMLEGKGILAINLDSTGILRPFTVGLEAPYVRGKVGRKWMSDIWDRSTVMSISEPRKNADKAKTNNGGIEFRLDEENYNKNRFALFHYPVLIWNDQVKSFLTKDLFSKMEKGTFAEHGVLYMNRRMEELTSAIRDFGRYVVESTRPKGNLFQRPIFWVIVVVVVIGILLVILFLPSIIDAMGGAWGSASNSVVQASQAARTPIQ